MSVVVVLVVVTGRGELSNRLETSNRGGQSFRKEGVLAGRIVGVGGGVLAGRIVGAGGG